MKNDNDVEAAERRLAATAAQINKLIKERNQLIAQLLDAGLSHRDVGRLALMSHNGAAKAARTVKAFAA